MKFKSIAACLDMAGCPNRCGHCWLGHGRNPNGTPDDLRFMADAFRPFTGELKIFSWYREPDFREGYRALFELERALSGSGTPHFELMSVWRAVRDPAYIPWLASLGVEQMQLTLFGGEALTDRYTGRRGAWQDIMRSIELLRAHGIIPRIQVFVDRVTARDLAPVEELVQALDYPAFVHAGSCVGAAMGLYDVRATPEELDWIPAALAEKSLRHWEAKHLREIFGEQESDLCAKLAGSNDTASFVSDTPTFFINGSWDVYPNHSAPGPAWRLGNLKRDGAEKVLACYLDETSPAQHVRRSVPLGELVRACGDPASPRLFEPEDFVDYLLEKYLQLMKENHDD